jgi:hypothetical protein
VISAMQNYSIQELPIRSYDSKKIYLIFENRKSPIRKEERFWQSSNTAYVSTVWQMMWNPTSKNVKSRPMNAGNL